ncbi:hypothetical protein SALBM135S_00637 [Streptomyces alboniger]
MSTESGTLAHLLCFRVREAPPPRVGNPKRVLHTKTRACERHIARGLDLIDVKEFPGSALGLSADAPDDPPTPAAVR